MANDGKDLVKYMAERFVQYIETPKEVRRQTRVKESWQYRWFGMMPVTFRIWYDRLFQHRR